MSEILKEDIVTIDGKEYVLRTVDLTATPLGGICPYEQLLYPLGEENKTFRGRLLDRSWSEDEALESHSTQVIRAKTGKFLLESY
jgi:hypothetical protein